MRHYLTLLVQAALLAIPLCAQQAGGLPAANQPDNAALMQKILDLEDRMVAMEGEIRQLKTQPPASATTSAAAAGAGAQTPVPPQVSTAPTQEGALQEPNLGGAGGSAAKALNPDISMIGDFIGVAGHNPVNPSPSFQMHESELGVQAIINPYARGDFFLSFGEEGVNLEEGFPGGCHFRRGRLVFTGEEQISQEHYDQHRAEGTNNGGAGGRVEQDGKVHP
jgi:hypothetical protein